MRYDFPGNVYQASANSGCISADWDDGSSNIFFEELHKKMARQHRIIPGSIGIESFERQLLMTEIFQGPVCRFITASLMVAGNNSVRLQIVFCSNFFQKRIDILALADIGDDNRIGSTPRQIKLVAVTDQSAVNSASEPVPGFAFTSKINILMVGMLITTSKNRIHNQPAPVHLQWLKSLFFVGGFDSMPA